MKAYRAQSLVELRLTLRQGEQLLVSLGIPLLLLVFFSLVDVLPTADQEPIEFLTPGILTLAVMGNAMVSLGIGTGFERQYGVLKRLGATPLGRPRLVAAKSTSVMVVEVVQVVLVVATASALGWQPTAGSGLGLAALVLGTAAFAGLGLTLAGSLPGLTNLAVNNCLYLVLLLSGGIVFPLDELPPVLEAVARLTPAAALSEVMRASLGGGDPTLAPWLTLMAWALLLPCLAARTFRWS